MDEWLSGDIREDMVGAIEQGASKLDDLDNHIDEKQYEALMSFSMDNCVTLEDTNGNRKLLKRR